MKKVSDNFFKVFTDMFSLVASLQFFTKKLKNFTTLLLKNKPWVLTVGGLSVFLRIICGWVIRFADYRRTDYLSVDYQFCGLSLGGFCLAGYLWVEYPFCGLPGDGLSVFLDYLWVDYPFCGMGYQVCGLSEDGLSVLGIICAWMISFAHYLWVDYRFCGLSGRRVSMRWQISIFMERFGYAIVS